MGRHSEDRASEIQATEAYYEFWGRPQHRVLRVLKWVALLGLVAWNVFWFGILFEWWVDLGWL